MKIEERPTTTPQGDNVCAPEGTEEEDDMNDR
jgi:hypothetical protein